VSKKLIISTILFVLLLSLAGCAGSKPPAQPPVTLPPVAATQPGVPTQPPVATQPAVQAPASAAIDACTLLTKADAEQILGKPVDAPTHPVTGNETFIVDSCEYRVTGATPLDNATLIVTVPAAGDQATAQAAFNLAKTQAQAAYGSAPLDVPGVGDAAFWVGGAGNNLSILKGNVYATLSASTQKGDSASQSLLDLAKVVLGRLP
jgi:hypothetical protein